MSWQITVLLQFKHVNQSSLHIYLSSKLTWINIRKCLISTAEHTICLFVFYPKWLTVHSGYTFFVSNIMCVPWELNPQPFALLTQCVSSKEPKQKLNSFNSFYLFYPVLTWISVETGCSCRARWRIAAAAHTICVLIGQISCQSSSLWMVNCAYQHLFTQQTHSCKCERS